MKLADDYALAQEDGIMAQQQHSGGGLPRVPHVGGKPVPVEGKVPQMALSRSPTPTEHSRTNVKGERRCFQCGTYGHIAVNCPSRGELRVAGTAKGSWDLGGAVCANTG